MKKFKYTYIHMDPFKDKYVQNQTLSNQDNRQAGKSLPASLSMKELNKRFNERYKQDD